MEYCLEKGSTHAYDYSSNLKMLIILQINQSLMNKCRSQIKSPNELIELQRLFLSELQGLQHRVTPLELPFYNLACYIVELMNEYCKSPLEVSFNIFIVDYHLRKYSSPTQAYRRFVGFLNSWKKNAQSDECQLFLTFLCPSRNCKRQVRLFLKLRKVLLKTINQKILQEINLTHQDAVTIIHTLNLISTEQKRLLTKKINEYFITKNVKYVNNAKFNSAIICEYLLSEIGNSSLQNYDTRLSKKFDTLMQPQYQPRHQDSSPQSPSSDKENSEAYEEAEQSSHKKSLVNLDHCLKELTILKQKDLQIDNRFRRLNLQKQGNK